jgi:hypothetical protein
MSRKELSRVIAEATIHDLRLAHLRLHFKHSQSVPSRCLTQNSSVITVIVA